MDGRSRSPAEPEEGNHEKRATDTCHWESEILSLLVRMPLDKRLCTSIEYVGADDRDHRAGEHDDKGKTGLASREAVYTLEYVRKDLQEPGI